MNLTPQVLSFYLDIPTEDLLDMKNCNKSITLSNLNKIGALFRCGEKYLLCRIDEFEYTPSQISDEIEIVDLEGIAGINRIYMNIKYMDSKTEKIN